MAEWKWKTADKSPTTHLRKSRSLAPQLLSVSASSLKTTKVLREALSADTIDKILERNNNNMATYNRIHLSTLHSFIQFMVKSRLTASLSRPPSRCLFHSAFYNMTTTIASYFYAFPGLRLSPSFASRLVNAVHFI